MAKIAAVTGNKTGFGKMVTTCIIRTIIASLITLVVYGSFTIIATGILTKEIGYVVRYVGEDGTAEDVYTHYLEDGEDPKLEQYVNENNDKYFKVGVRSALTKGQKICVMLLTQIVSLIVWVTMIYVFIWDVGDADATKEDFGAKSYDKLRGIKAALAADIPFVVAYLMFVVNSVFGGVKWYPTVYKFLTYYLFTVNELFLPGGTSLGVGNYIGGFVSLLPLPAIVGVAYYLGQKHISLKEKIVYTKEKQD